MPIPAEIREVERPPNTIVVAYGKNKDRYAVRQRIACKYENGRRKPINGPTIGHIIDGRFVPVEGTGSASGSVSAKAEGAAPPSSPVLKDWAGFVLCDRLFKDVFHDLLAVYTPAEARKIYCIAILRVCCPGIKDDELKDAYENSFLSELYPGTALSKKVVGKFLSKLGSGLKRIILFMRGRAAAVPPEHHLIIDSVLKSSADSPLSSFSREARHSAGRTLSVLFAYDLEDMEPVCSECFEDAVLDAAAYREFVSLNAVVRGVVSADTDVASASSWDGKSLHFLKPVERTSEVVLRHNMLDVTAFLPGTSTPFRKEKCAETGRWLYSYCDLMKALSEERDWMRRTAANGTYNLEDFRREKKAFGMSIFECDLDLPPEVVYKVSASREEIGLVMRSYTSVCGVDEGDDYGCPYIGGDFCDFLAAVLTSRLIKAFDKAGLLNSQTYKKIMSVLMRARQISVDGGKWQMVSLSPAQVELLQALELMNQDES